MGSTLATSFLRLSRTSRLLRMRLVDDELPFSENIVYLFDQQIEETQFAGCQ
jgi:hypothetical protein